MSVGESAGLTMQVGHGDARQRSPIPSRRILRFAALTPSGEMLDLRMNGVLAPTEVGLHLLVLETDANAQSVLPADLFNAYVRDEGLRLVAAQRARRGTAGQGAIERYRRVAKALVQAGEPGEGPQQLATKRVGLPLELVLLRAPADLAPAEPLSVQVFHAGRPLEGALVKLTNVAEDAQPVASAGTDAQGRAHFAHPPEGSWLLNVIWSVPLDGQDGIDFDTVFSSLTFHVPPPG